MRAAPRPVQALEGAHGTTRAGRSIRPFEPPVADAVGDVLAPQERVRVRRADQASRSVGSVQVCACIARCARPRPIYALVRPQRARTARLSI
eukprot:1342066-Rhodomonas_salina.1